MGIAELPFAAEPTDIHCASCGQRADGGESFCARCGKALRGDDAAAAALAPMAVGSTTDAVRTAAGVSLARPKVVRIAALVVMSVVALGAIAAVTFLWRGEVSDHLRTQRFLAASRSNEAALQERNVALHAKLDETAALAARRAAMLARAQRVLAQVTPLLSSVDAVQAVSQKMQASRRSYADAAETLKSDLIALANYLLDVSPEYIDYGYVNNLIDSINGEISTFSYYGGELTGYDGDYTGASDRFETKASLFTSAVEALKKQLSMVSPAK